MKTKFKIVWFILVIMFLFTSQTFAMGAGQKHEEEIRIGAAIALTGYGAAFGESEKNAIAMLKEEYDVKQIKFFIEDNKSNPKDGVSAVNKLININKADIVYCDLTTVSNAINPILAKNKKILIASVYLKSLLDNNRYAIRNLPTGKQESKLLLSYLKKHGVPLNKISSLVSNDEFGNSSLLDFKKVLDEFKGKLIYEGTIPDLMNLKSEVTKLLHEKPSVVYIASLYSHVGNVIKELRIHGYKGKIITTDAFPYPNIIEAAGKYAKDTIYVDFPTNEKCEEFTIRYKERFGINLLPTAILCHDGLSFIINLIKQKGNKSLEEFIGSLDGKKFNGIFGTIKIENREIRYPLTVKVW